MAGNYAFHNKYHNASHYTVSGFGVEGGSDPIASNDFPFLGIFHNIVTDQPRSFAFASNSLEWFLAYNTISTLSSIWAPTDSLYETVRALSAQWNDGFSGYVSYAPASARFISVYDTVNALSSNWFNEYTMYTNRAQEYTQSKTFSGTNLTITIPPSTVEWNVQSNQITFFQMASSTFFKNPTNIKNGGTYAIVLSTNTTSISAFFDTTYRLSNALRYTRTINLSGYSKVVLDFVSDGTLMFCNPTYYLE